MSAEKLKTYHQFKYNFSIAENIEYISPFVDVNRWTIFASDQEEFWEGQWMQLGNPKYVSLNKEITKLGKEIEIKEGTYVNHKSCQHGLANVYNPPPPAIR